MNFIDIIDRQPRAWVLTWALAFFAFFAFVDVTTPWQFSMFIFYCLPVYVISLRFQRRIGIAFAVCAALLALAANTDSIPSCGFGGFAWLGFSWLGGFLFAAYCGISFRDYREETRRRIQALEQKELLERKIVRVAELEQRRIGQDLHDGVCQTLAALSCAAQCLKVALATEDPRKTKLAEDILKGLTSATLEARNLARGINPVAIEGSTLDSALKDLVRTMGTLYAGEIKFESDDEIGVNDPEVVMHIYRITQEALSNAMRHAKATRVFVRLRRENGRLVITVADNGCGSTIQERPDGMGLFNMRHRANLISAEIAIDTAASKGTTVRCTLPAPAPTA